MSQNIITANELLKRLDDPQIIILDCSWYLPSQAVDAEGDYRQRHIPGALFFDIDAVCDQQSDLPHMLPTETQFATAVSALGVGNDQDVVVYDTAGLFSAARVWWMFRVFGHSRVRVLSGGLPAWEAADGEVTSAVSEVTGKVFNACLDASLLTTKAALIDNCDSKEYTVLDARSEARFTGEAAEPRPGLPSGHMPQSLSLPFDRLLDSGQLKPRADLLAIFESLGISSESQLITSCGSGVTAAIISLALDEAGYGLKPLYDGAWAEWGAAEDTIILTG